jgi:hypothetical protein
MTKNGPRPKSAKAASKTSSIVSAIGIGPTAGTAPSVVHDDVHVAKLRDCLAKEATDVGDRTGVRLNCDGLTALRLDTGDDLAGLALAAGVVDHNCGAVLRKSFDDRASNSARRAGDDSHFATERCRRGR